MILVIGLSGHTGGYFLDNLILNNYKEKIRVFAHSDKGLEKLKDSKLDYEIIYGDLNDINLIEKACEGVNEIVEIYNIRYSLNVLNAALKQKVKRIIFVHTTGIYSKFKMASGEYKEIEEKVYEISKNKIDITILRPTMIYGDLCDLNISKFIKMISKIKIFPLIANGRAKIQPVNARDLGKAYYDVLVNYESTKNKDYNLSGATEISLRNMLKLIKEKMQTKNIFIPIPIWLSVFGAYVLKILTFNKINIVEKVLRMDESRCFSYEKAKKDFGYTPMTFEEGVEIEVKQLTKTNKKVLFSATVDSHILHFHLPYLKLFKEKGYEVHVATNGTEEIPYCDVKHTVTFERSPFKINNLKAIKQLKQIIDKEEFEIIHTHTPMGSVVTRLAAKEARKKGTKVIYTAHGFHFFKGAPIINWLMFYSIEKHLGKITDDLILINEEDYNLAKKKFKAKNIHLVHGVGVDPEKFNFEFSEEEKEKLRNEVGVTKDDFVMIYPAELNKNKNQGMLIKVMKELVKEDKNYKLLLPGIDSYNGKYQKIAEKYGLENNIKFLGYRTDIPKLLRISNMAVASSKREGLPVNLIEASICGLPIIATNCRGNRDVAGIENSIKINDIIGFKNKIIDVKNKEKAMVKEKKEYTIENTIIEIEKVYKNVL